MCEKHVFPAAVEQNERSQILVWVSTPQRGNLFRFLFSGTIIVGLIFYFPLFDCVSVFVRIIFLLFCDLCDILFLVSLPEFRFFLFRKPF